MMSELAQAYGLVENQGINWIFIHNAKKVIWLQLIFEGLKKEECEGSFYSVRRNFDTALPGSYTQTSWCFYLKLHEVKHYEGLWLTTHSYRQVEKTTFNNLFGRPGGIKLSGKVQRAILEI